MRRFFGSGFLSWVLCIAAWRLVSEVEQARRTLAASGALDCRTAARRARRIARVVSRDVDGASAELVERWSSVWGIRGGSLSMGTPVAVAVPVDDAPARACHGLSDSSIDVRARAAMHAGAVRIGDVDVDDMSLLDGSMRRAAAEGLALGGRGVERRSAMQRIAGAHPGWLALGSLGVVLTAVPLVRPLADGALALAMLGALCAAAAWFGAGRGS